MQRYLKDIGKYPLLTVKQEKKHTINFQKTGDERSREILITSNLRFVIKIAKYYDGQGIDLDDLIQEGNMGLMKAIDKFDPSKGFRLTTYASWWIKQSIMLSLSENKEVIRIPASRINLFTKINKAKEKLRHQLDREPYYYEVEEYLEGINLSKGLIGSEKTIELNSQNQYDQEVINFIEQSSAKDTDSTDVEDIKKEISIISRGFPEREKAVIELYFGLGGTKHLTLEEIGNLYQLTRERIRQIKERVLTKLRNSPEIKKLKAYL